MTDLPTANGAVGPTYDKLRAAIIAGELIGYGQLQQTEIGVRYAVSKASGRA